MFCFGPGVLLGHGRDDTRELRGLSWRYPERTFCYRVWGTLRRLLTNVLLGGVNGQRWRSRRGVLLGYRSRVGFDPISWLREVSEWWEWLLREMLRVEFRSGECPGVEGYGVDLIIFSHNRKNSSKSVVWGISFHDELRVWNPIRKDRSGGKGLFQGIECYPTIVVKVPWTVLSSETSEWNDYVWIIENETFVEVGETLKGLDILYFLWFRPLLNGFSL